MKSRMGTTRITARRGALAMLALLVAVSAPTKVLADDPDGELDATLYGGQSRGGWTCGPRATARYAGVGAEYRYTARLHGDEHGGGLDITGGSSVEYEDVKLVHCDEDQVCEVPPAHMMMGAGLRAGYRWRHAGISAGFIAYQGWPDSNSEKPRMTGFPQLRAIGGKEDGLSWITGTGASLPTTYRRPALLFTGPQLQSLANGWRVQIFGGLYRTGPALLSETAPRLDAALSLRVTEGLWFGAQTALAQADGRGGLDGEFALSLRFRF